MVEAVARSPLLEELRCEVVMVGDETAIGREHLEWAKTSLSVAGLDVQVAVAAGEPETVLPHYLKAHSVDLLVIGAYGHSRIRQLIVAVASARR